MSKNWIALVFEQERVICDLKIFITAYTRVYIYPALPHERDVTQGQFFRQSLTGLSSEFSFFYTGCHNKVKVLNLPDYLPTAAGRIIGFISFPRG